MIALKRFTITCSLLFAGILAVDAQEILTMPAALQLGVERYPSIASKGYNVQSSKYTVAQSRRDYLPNLVLSAQHDYGTINGQNGPLYGLGGFGVASSGLPLDHQSWNAAFGALYLANVNWEFFTFGRLRERIMVAQAAESLNQTDLEQEQFQHQVRIAAAYLNLLASQRLVRAQERNLERTVVFRNNIVTRAKNGLVAGVDSALANAEVSNAKIALVKVRDLAQEQQKNLAVLVGSPGADFTLDSSFVARVPVDPAIIPSEKTEHPLLSYYKSRMALSMKQEKLIRRSYYPSFLLFGVIQKRGSGFSSNYAVDQTAFTTDYFDGIKPTRTNYLVGLGVTWNITSITRGSAQAKAQSFTTLSMQSDFQLVDQQIKAQYATSDEKLKNAFIMYNETPVQITAATNAYQQRSVLYKNGLSTLVELTQALYTLNRAETDRDIAYINVWQALLMKAAASGDLSLFKNEL